MTTTTTDPAARRRVRRAFYAAAARAIRKADGGAEVVDLETLVDDVRAGRVDAGDALDLLKQGQQGQE